MQRRLVVKTTYLFTLIACGILLCSGLAGQNAPTVSLEEQLNAQYKLAKVGRATGQWAIVEPGTILEIQKGGIVGSAPTKLAICPSRFESGNLKGPGGMCTGLLGRQNIRYLTVGEKVYPVKMDVNLKKDKITLAIFECDSCNGATEPSSYRSEVIFQFDKGYLGTASAGQIEDTIGQVLSISTGDAQQSQNERNGAEPQQAVEQPQPEPQTIHLGQTTDQVISALGKPEKIVDLGAKQIYVYKDIKVTFFNGKVSDVQ